MPNMFRRDLAIGLLLTVLVWLFGQAWVQSPLLSTFSDDSTSYLLLGQFFIHPTSLPAELRPYALWEIQYPPLFPWLIGWFDNTTSLTGARQTVILIYALALAALWWLARQRLNTALALLLLSWVLLAPLPWVLLKSIHSEGLYLGLSLLTLGLVQGQSRTAIWGMAVALSLTCLTRTVGLGLWLAVAWTLLGRRQRLQHLPVLLLPIGTLVVWYLVRPHGDDMYSSLISDYLTGKESIRRIITDIPYMAGRIAGEWHRLFALTNDGWGLRLLSGGLGLAAIAGAVWRAWRGQIDGTYVLIYLAVLLIWPYPAESARFLWPIMPLGLLLALEAYQQLWQRFAPPLALHSLLALPSLLIAFGFATFLQRAGDTREILPGVRFAEMTDFFQRADPIDAAREAANTAAMLQTFGEISRQTPTSARILWSNPKYLWRYAQRIGVPGYARWDRPALLQAARQHRVDYVLITAINGSDLERNLLNTLHWQTMLQGCLADQRVIYNVVSGQPRAILSKLDLSDTCR